MASVTQRDSWKKLEEHFEQVKNTEMKDLFNTDPGRQHKFSVFFEDIMFDYSKNRITNKTLKLLLELANEVNLKQWISSMVNGEKINATENRRVLHTALRSPKDKPILIEGNNIAIDIHRELDKIEAFTNNIISGKLVGYSGKKITDVVNIGIGGSDLGPQMVVNALKPFQKNHLKCHFISNIDPMHFLEKIHSLSTETTLFVIASKSFTTQETMLNANSAKNWFLAKANSFSDIAKHFVAVSTNKEKVESFGINPDNMFLFWDWVGGRYSLWSSIGLSIVFSIGMNNFKQLLEGANAMDEHFINSPFENNIPVIMALLGIWYNNFFNCESHAILPYDHQLDLLPAYLKQADMESNGKSVTRDGIKVDYSTGAIIWGAQGINGQHAFYQLIHQGTKIIPADFISSVMPENEVSNHHDAMLSNFMAQMEALMCGRTKDETLKSLHELNLTESEVKKRLPHMVFEGNKPTNAILFKKITPRTLGSLIAMYEHKIFVQGVVWNINSFDQFGVELGKKLAKRILTELTNENFENKHDSSTSSLMRYYQLFRTKKENKPDNYVSKINTM